MDQTITKDTSQLNVGDVVRTNGMRVRVEHVTTYEDREHAVWSCVGTVINADEVKASDSIPQYFLYCHGQDVIKPEALHAHERHTHGQCWTIQGNTLATWTVEVPMCGALSSHQRNPYSCVKDPGHDDDHLAWDSTGLHRYTWPAETEDTRWPEGKTFGELTPAQRRAAMRQAMAQLQTELQAHAEAIGKALEPTTDEMIAALDAPGAMPGDPDGIDTRTVREVYDADLLDADDVRDLYRTHITKV